MKLYPFILATMFTVTQAGTPFLDQLEERSARFAAIQTVLLMDVQDTENDQICAFQIYSEHASKEIIHFGELLQKSNVLVNAMREKPSQQQINDLKVIISEMDSCITRLKSQRQKITPGVCN